MGSGSHLKGSPPLTSANQWAYASACAYITHTCTHTHECTWAHTVFEAQSFGALYFDKKRKVYRKLTPISASTSCAENLPQLRFPRKAPHLIFLPRNYLLVPEKTKEEQWVGTLIKSTFDTQWATQRGLCLLCPCVRLHYLQCPTCGGTKAELMTRPRSHWSSRDLKVSNLTPNHVTFFPPVLGIKLRVSYMLGKCSAPMPYPRTRSQDSSLTVSQKKRKLEAKTQSPLP